MSAPGRPARAAGSFRPHDIVQAATPAATILDHLDGTMASCLRATRVQALGMPNATVFSGAGRLIGDRASST